MLERCWLQALFYRLLSKMLGDWMVWIPLRLLWQSPAVLKMEYFLRSEVAKIISPLVLCCTKIVPACYFARPLTRGAGQIAFQLSPSLLPGDLQLSVIIRYRCFALLGAFFFWGTVPPRWSYFMVAQKLLSGFFPLRVTPLSLTENRQKFSKKWVKKG